MDEDAFVSLRKKNTRQTGCELSGGTRHRPFVRSHRCSPRGNAVSKPNRRDRPAETNERLTNASKQPTGDRCTSWIASLDLEVR